MKTRFVLFDLDGTLVDSSPLHDRAFREAIARARPEWLDSFDYERVRGMPTREAFASLGERDPDALRELVRAKREAFARMAGDLRAFPGARALLALLTRRGVGIYVVTSAGRASARRALRRTGLMRWVVGIVAAEDVSHGKPSPEPYRKALRRFGLRASEGLVIEDAEAGLVSARAAGLRALRVHGAVGEDLTLLAASLRSSLPRRARRATVSSWSSLRSYRRQDADRA